MERTEVIASPAVLQIHLVLIRVESSLRLALRYRCEGLYFLLWAVEVLQDLLLDPVVVPATDNSWCDLCGNFGSVDAGLVELEGCRVWLLGGIFYRLVCWNLPVNIVEFALVCHGVV